MKADNKVIKTNAKKLQNNKRDENTTNTIHSQNEDIAEGKVETGEHE